MRALILAAAVLGATAYGPPRSSAQTVAGSPSAQPAPMLERISRETQSLYEFVRPGLVRVELPPPNWADAYTPQDDPLTKWQLDPKMRQALKDEGNRVLAGKVRTTITPSTQPGGSATQPSDPGDTRRWQRTLVQRPDGSFDIVAPDDAPEEGIVGAITAPRTIGVLLDEQGHIVIPVYVEKEAVGEDHPLAVYGLSEGAAAARFVGSDRQTNLTVLKLIKPLGKPGAFAGTKPAEGELVMMLSPAGEGGRLAVWTRNQQDRGVVIGMDGRVTGFARWGQFLGADIARPVIDQLVQFGTVKRAMLGVLITESEAPDGRRAMHVDRVKPASPAELGGLKSGDYIVLVAGKPVDDLPNFAAAVSSANGPTPIQVLRNGQIVELKVMLRPQ